MKNPKFSIIIPVYSELEPLQSGASGHRHFRAATIQRAIKSVIAQQYPDWELILVNDGCVDQPRDKDGVVIEGSKSLSVDVMEKFALSDKRIKIYSKENENRAIARNFGMEKATGEWLCWLDSDDEYSTNYLRQLDKATRDFPDYSIFNFGSIIHWPDHNTSLRPVFRPEIEGSGHEWFKSGNIGAGSFIFKKELWQSDGKYSIPNEVNPYQFAATSGFDLRLADDEPDIENPGTAFGDYVYRHGLSLGNPWGDDFLQFYLLTRDNLSKPLDCLLYVQYPRSHEDDYQHFGEIYEVN